MMARYIPVVMLLVATGLPAYVAASSPNCQIYEEQLAQAEAVAATCDLSIVEPNCQIYEIEANKLRALEQLAAACELSVNES